MTSISTTSWRALTLKQPWPWAIVYAGKDVENRTWPVPPKLFRPIWKRDCSKCGGPIAGQLTRVCSQCERWPSAVEVMIHAGKQWDKNAGPIVAKPFWNMKGSAWIGSGNVSVYYGVEATPPCSPWAMFGEVGEIVHHWELADVRPLTEPVPAKGKLGLWIPDAELVEAVEEQI